MIWADNLASAILPGLRSPVPSVAVVLDTSASMGTDEVTSALSEIQGVLKILGSPTTVLATDAVVHNVQRISSVKQIKVLGGGGTDMGVGIAEAAKLRPRPDVIIVVTDGYTPWPDRAAYGIKTVVATLGEKGPRWATTVNIKKD